MSCGLGSRRGLDPTLLWLWRRPVATAPIGPLAWEHSYAVVAVLKKTKKKEERKKERNKQTNHHHDGMEQYFIKGLF